MKKENELGGLEKQNDFEMKMQRQGAMNQTIGALNQGFQNNNQGKNGFKSGSVKDINKRNLLKAREI